MKIFVAGPLFSVGERRFLEELAVKLEEDNHKVFLPHRDNPYNEGESNLRFLKNREYLLWSDIIVAVLDGQDIDSGTACEIGMAYGMKKPVLGIATDVRRALYLNAMPKAICANILKDIPSALKDIERESNKKRYKDGC